MLRLVLLTFCAAVLYVSGAQAHGYHADCRVGQYRPGWGSFRHWHPGGYGRAVACGGRGGRLLRRRLWRRLRSRAASWRLRAANQPRPGLLQRLRQPDLLPEGLDRSGRTLRALSRILIATPDLNNVDGGLSRGLLLCFSITKISFARSAAVHRQPPWSTGGDDRDDGEIDVAICAAVFRRSASYVLRRRRVTMRRRIASCADCGLW